MERIVCEICNTDLTYSVRIQCAQEACGEMSLCIPCFGNGSEIGVHRNFHPYRVMDKLSFPLYEREWGADEELRLLEGLSLRGMGNWTDVADHVETRTKQECEEHYLRVYVHSPKWPFPVEQDFPKDADTLVHRKKRKLGGGEKKKTWVSGPCYHPEVYGYMPARGEFDMEAENEAEMDVKSIIFTPEDTQGTRDLKLTLLEIYNDRLDRRLQRRKFVLDRNLLNYRAAAAFEKGLPKDDRESLQALKVFAPLITKEDSDAFIEGILKEQQLKRRIALLQEWRLNGIRTQEDGMAYENAKNTRASQPRAPSTRDAAGGSGTYSPGGALAHRGGGKMGGGREDGPAVSAASGINAGALGNKSKPIGRKQAIPLDISDAPDVHLLSPGEVDLCSSLRLLPQAYLAIKATIIREAARRTTMRKRDARDHIKIDVNKISTLWDFWVTNGWIRPASANKADAIKAAAPPAPSSH